MKLKIGDQLIGKKQRQRLNEDITSSEVRLISEDGEQLGVVSIEVALDKAKEVMGDRLGDETYTFARLVQVIANEVDCFEDSRRYGNLSVGVGTYGTVSIGDDYGDYFVDGSLNIKNHIKGRYQE